MRFGTKLLGCRHAAESASPRSRESTDSPTARITVAWVACFQDMTRRLYVREDGPWLHRFGAAESFLALHDPAQTLDELFRHYRGRTKMPVDAVALRLLRGREPRRH